MKPSTPKCNQALRGFPRTPRGNYICCYIVTRCLNHFPRSHWGEMQNWQVLNPPPSCSCCSSFSMENGHLLLICSSLFAPEKDAKSCQNAKASLSLSVGKLLFFVLSSLKQDQKNHGRWWQLSEFLISPTFGLAFFWVFLLFTRLPGDPLKTFPTPPPAVSEISRISTSNLQSGHVTRSSTPGVPDK